MVQSPFVPQAALAAGLPARYHYWRGRSGRRYLFTQIEPAALADFADCVVILAVDGGIVFSGDAAGARSILPTFRKASVHVHLLAAGPAARRAVGEDLAPCVPRVLRLAA